MTIENWILYLAVLLLNAVTFFLLTKDPELYVAGEGGRMLVSRRFTAIYGVCFVLLNMGIAVMFTYVYPTNTLLFSLKRFSILALLWPVALIDWKTYRIPNRFVLAGLGFRTILFVGELFLDNGAVWGNLISEAIAAGALGLATLLCSVCMKNSIGFGDLKLFLVMGLLLGTNGIWGAIFMSLIVAFIMAIFLLVTKKKSKKDVVPFAPSIMIGTYISVILTGM